MKIRRPIFPAGILLALIALFAIGAAGILPAAAATAPSHAGHDHESRPHQDEEMEDLFAEDDGHSEEGEAGHAGHADHAGHRDEAVSHEGHDHGGEGDICPEHNLPEEEDALCHGDRLGDLQPGQGMKVRLASPEVATRAGVTLTRPQAVSLAEGVALPGRVEFNRTRLAHIAPPAPGVVRRVRVQPGAQVIKGQILAEVVIPEMASLKARFRAARAREAQTAAAFHREKDLLERGITSRQEFQVAEAEFLGARSASEEARQQLETFGLSPAAVEQLLLERDSGAFVAVAAPFAGTIVEVKTALGEAVAPTSPVFTLADLDLLWLELSLPESRVDLAEVDAPVEARFAALPGRIFQGRIFQVGAALDERTRTLKALAAVKNPRHRLKVGMFGDVRLLQGDEAQVLVLPADALQSMNGLSFVFVRQEDDLFELRRVLAGAAAEGSVSILAGLSPGEEVVASQGFALKSEVLKARLGASCADH